jgi:hypothetical protein
MFPYQRLTAKTFGFDFCSLSLFSIKLLLIFAQEEKVLRVSNPTNLQTNIIAYQRVALCKGHRADLPLF